MKEEKLIMNENVKPTYNWSSPLLPGTIVCASYEDFDGVKRVGLFCILYDEQLDGSISEKRNVVACKVSSQVTLAADYSCMVSAQRNAFFDKPCMVCTSKVRVLDKVKNVYKILGQLDSYTFARVVKTYVKFSNEVNRQLLDRI